MALLAQLLSYKTVKEGNTWRKRGGKSSLQLPSLLTRLWHRSFIAKLPTDEQSKLVLIPSSYCSSAGHMCDMRHRDEGHGAGAR